MITDIKEQLKQYIQCEGDEESCGQMAAAFFELYPDVKAVAVLVSRDDADATNAMVYYKNNKPSFVTVMNLLDVVNHFCRYLIDGVKSLFN